MRQISNSSMQTLLRHLPRVLKAVEGTGDARLSESARLLYIALRKFRRAEREIEKREKVIDILDPRNTTFIKIFTDGIWLTDKNGNKIERTW